VSSAWGGHNHDGLGGSGQGRNGRNGGRRESGDFVSRTAFRSGAGNELPRNASSGECFAQIYLPPEFETVTERVVVREASEKLEVIPAKYEWTEERILVKEASTQLVEVPAQYDTQEQVVETNPGLSTWIKAPQARCVVDTPGPAPQDIFCLVKEPASSMTIQKERLVKGATVREVSMPAEYQTIRKQKLVQPASTRSVQVPAEYKEIEKTVLVSPGRLEWQRVKCDAQAMTEGLRMQKQVRPVRHTNP
jgi:hypothetical protein